MVLPSYEAHTEQSILITVTHVQKLPYLLLEPDQHWTFEADEIPISEGKKSSNVNIWISLYVSVVFSCF